MTSTTMSAMTTPVSCIVPTLGRSPWLHESLVALRRDVASSTGRPAHVVLVCQAWTPPPEICALADVLLNLDTPCGFAVANNLALAHCHGPYVALVNDDAIVDDGWCQALLDLLETHPRAAAAQGVQRLLDDETTLDGWGIGWNHYWQAVQLGHGQPLGSTPETPCQVFGVSATAALFRRQALDDIAPDGQIFETKLFAYYEDVHLAGRLRAAGYEAWMTPAAAARHGASTSGHQMQHQGRHWIYGNRQLVLMDLLGRGFWRQWPVITWRDLADGYRCITRRQWAGLAGIAAGHGRALRRIPSFLRWGPPRLPLDELESFRVDP